MSHVNVTVPALEERYGIPDAYNMTWQATANASGLLARAAEQGRFHDITMLIARDDDLAVIRKPSYPPHVFRPPSGGVEPNETVEQGAEREAYEETGMKVRLQRYLVRADITFEGPNNVTLPWCTHVFLAEWRSGEPCPIDRREIAQARWASRAEVSGDLQAALDESADSGLRYRGWVQRAAFRAL